jgi:hypothetical protein
MAEYATQAVIWPPVPADLLDENTKTFLTTCGIQWEKHEDDRLYLFAEDGPYNGMHFAGDDAEPSEVDYVEVLQKMVARSEGRLKALTIEAADTCSKMRSDGFGGWAMVITVDEAHYLATFQWVREKVTALNLHDDVYGPAKQGEGHVDDLG